MSRPLTLLGQAAKPTREIHTGTIKLADVDGTCTYILDDQDDRVRGPARYFRSGSPSATAAGPDSHAHARSAPPPEGTPCLVVLVAGQFSDAWVLAFE